MTGRDSLVSLDALWNTARTADKDGGYYADGWTYDEWTRFGIDGPEAAHIAAASPWAVIALVEAVQPLHAFAAELRAGGHVGSAIESMESRDWRRLAAALAAFDFKARA